MEPLSLIQSTLKTNSILLRHLKVTPSAAIQKPPTMQAMGQHHGKRIYDVVHTHPKKALLLPQNASLTFRGNRGRRLQTPFFPHYSDPPREAKASCKFHLYAKRLRRPGVARRRAASGGGCGGGGGGRDMTDLLKEEAEESAPNTEK